MCGISGYCGAKPPSVQVIKLLAIYNMKRGTDSFGIYWDGKVDKFIYQFGVSSGNSFEQMYGTVLHPQTKDPNVLMHSRQRSVGIVNLANAHPFEYDFEGRRFVFAHNGTIKNIEDLAKKYHFRHPIGATDSETLGWLIVSEGWDVLSHYEGAAAFSLYDTAERALYLWRGESKHDSYQITEERPLYYHQSVKKMYYSSEPLTLVTALNIKQNIDILPANTVCKFIDGVLVETIAISRAHIEYSPSVTYYSSANTAKNHRGVSTPPPANFVYDKEASPVKFAKGRFYFHAGKHYRNGHLANGQFDLNEEGEIVYGPDKMLGDFKTYCFISGYLIKDEETYEKLISKELVLNLETGLSTDILKVLHPETMLFRIYPQSAHITMNREDVTEGIWTWLRSTEKVTPIFGYYSYSNPSNRIVVHPLVEEAGYEDVLDSELGEDSIYATIKAQRDKKKKKKIKDVNMAEMSDEEIARMYGYHEDDTPLENTTDSSNALTTTNEDSTYGGRNHD